MNYEGLSDTQNQLLATYGGTNVEAMCREMTAVDDPGVDPDFRPRVLNGLPWWTMKIPGALKYLPLLEKAWDEAYWQGVEDERTAEAVQASIGLGGHATPNRANPYRQETDA